MEYSEHTQNIVNTVTDTQVYELSNESNATCSLKF